MPTFIVPRPSSIGHFVVGAGIVAFVQLLSLAPISLGFLGSPWPFAIIWAISGWSVLGPDWRIGGIIFFLGLLMDIICGTNLGTNALMYLITYGGVLFISKSFGFLPRGEWMEAAIIVGLFVFGALITGVLTGEIPNLIRMLAPAIFSIALYPIIARFFLVTREVV